MSNEARFDRHARLLARMAGALGVDIETKVQSGELLPEERDTQIFDCMGCTRPDGCTRWIDAQVRIAEAAPAFCRNRDALGAMVRS